MERLLQYLDDLDDFVYAIALTWERIRTFCTLALAAVVTVLAQLLGIYMAIQNPPAAVAFASLLIVALLYRGAVRNVQLSQPAL